MQIHELNEYTENPSAGDWLIVDTGDDTAKVSGARFAYKTQMDIIEAEIDDVLTNNNGYKIDTLWEGSIYSGGSTAPLANPISGYDFIDFYMYFAGEAAIYTVDAKAGNCFVRNFNLTDDTSSTSLTLYEIKLVLEAQSLNLEFNHAWKWSGKSSASASKSSNDSGCRVTKIVGRKCNVDQNDAEVEDIRIGYNGTVYPSAGDAVRTQIEEAMQSGGGGGGTVTVDSELSTTSTNPVQNKVITEALNDKANSNMAIPSGGSAGQFLVKSSSTDYDVEWMTLSTWQGGNY